MFSNTKITGLFFLLLIIFSVYTRFIGLNWGNGFYFHPDENNMAASLSQLTIKDLNPRFYAYGQFPMYLGFFTLKLFFIPNNFSNSIFILRLWSAIFSVLAVIVFYLIIKKIFKPQLIFLGTLIFIFYPGLIQLSHFGTTESLLILVFLSNIYLSFKIIESPDSWRYYFFIALITAVGLASKISSLIFLYPVLIAILVSFITSNHKFSFVPKFMALIIFSAFLSLLLSPYSFINRSDFISTQIYETGVATGKYPVFYTRQFTNTIPYLFQIKNIFPYTSGLPTFIIGIFGLVMLITFWPRMDKQFKLHWLIIMSSAIIYFSYFGQLFTKWTRFVSPIFFVFPLLAAFLLSKLNIKLALIFTIICCIPGMVFISQYQQPDIRITASQWIESNISDNSHIFSEAGNVINLPITNKNFKITNFDFYGLDEDGSLQSSLPEILSTADFIIIPSRRMFKNQSNINYPYSYRYYSNLFNGSLGFIPIKQFSPNTDIFLNPENAEETWTVFDRPTIRIYKKIRQLEKYQYETLLKT